MNNGRGRPSASVFNNAIGQISDKLDSIEKRSYGAEHFRGATKEWNNKLSAEAMEITIEQLLSDPYYLGNFNIWPSVRKEIEEIWHMRCDFNVTLLDENGKSLKIDTTYALTYEHAEEKVRAKWPRLSPDAPTAKVWRNRDLHTVIIETPKGTGKDFEMSILIVLLVREYLIQDRKKFFKPYNLDIDTPISINCANRSEVQAKKVTFKEVLPKFNTPFFRDYFPPQIDIASTLDSRIYPSELAFPRNIAVFPGSGEASTGLGYTFGAAVIDECNFMSKSDSSKRSILGESNYDAADEIYTDSHRRHFSRLSTIRNGKEVCAGIIVGISSTIGGLSFTQRMKIRAEDDDGILYINNFYWDRKPLPLSGKTFQFDLNAMAVINPEKALQTKDELNIEHTQVQDLLTE